ncbi:MAG: DNA-binding domain-containing protein [Colwellia sp.]|nr:DNA-binding domain-containing protein [Colwellia sp.]
MTQINKTNKKNDLAQQQRNFISDCLSGKLTTENTLMAPYIDSSSISAQGLMGIYQGNAIANITNSLSLTYPVIEKLVGQDFFKATCRQFILIHWPTSGNMDDYGAEFANFLAEFEHAKHLLYLKDVARLEWGFHQSSLSDDASVTDWSTLANVTDILQLHFILAPTVNLISSTFPIDKIWLLNQENTPSEDLADIDLGNDKNNQSDTLLLLFRQQLKTVILPVSQGEFSLLQAFDKGQPFELAIVGATNKQASFSVDDSLKKLIELGVVCGFIENN